jgi:hypothetical protein
MTKTLAAEIVVDIILFTCKVTSFLEGCGSRMLIIHCHQEQTSPDVDLRCYLEQA